eukprot:15454967-Alexandrium_andersonii.AAC.1
MSCSDFSWAPASTAMELSAVAGVVRDSLPCESVVATVCFALSAHASSAKFLSWFGSLGRFCSLSTVPLSLVAPPPFPIARLC